MSTLFFAALIITVTQIWLLVAKIKVRFGQSLEIKIKVEINQGKVRSRLEANSVGFLSN